jgi:hypothetical protein
MRTDQGCLFIRFLCGQRLKAKGKFRSHLHSRLSGEIVGRHASTHASPLDRRRFLLNAGFAAAGSVIGSSLLSCAHVTDGTFIPCLGPAAAPSPVPGMTYIRASEIGCALDCDLEWGYNKYTMGHPTDDGPRINAAMADASASHPITLIIDGSALISGLFLPAGGYWSIAGLGCGTGFFIKAAANNDGIHNGPPDAAVPFDPGPPAPPRGMNVSLSNFTLNGNQGNGRTGDSSSGLPRGNDLQFFCSINLMNLDNVRIENVVVVNSPAYHFRLSNVGNVVATGCYMESRGLGTDGMHFDGPANDISISNCTFATGDDSIALNCPEGHSGNISRVTVTNCSFKSWTLMRLYTTYYGSPIKDQIDSVSVSKCNGTLAEAAFLIGLSSGSIPDSVASLTVSDCTLKAPTILGVAENFGNITLRNVIFTPSLSGVVWNPPITNRICAFLRPTPPYGGGACAGSNLILENCQIIRDSHIDVAAVILENNSTIDNVSFNGFAVQDSYPPLPDLLIIGNGSIGQLALSSINSTSISGPIGAGSFVNLGLVLGAGVLATGWEFPDAVMANEVPYISASSGLPSIKVGGVVELYSPT